MALTVELSQEIDKKLQEWSQRTNQTKDEIVRKAVESYLGALQTHGEKDAWQRVITEQFFRGYVDADSVYDTL